MQTVHKGMDKGGSSLPVSGAKQVPENDVEEHRYKKKDEKGSAFCKYYGTANIWHSCRAL